MRAYEKLAVLNAAQPRDPWWHHANSLWHACREYERRHHNCEESARRVSSRRAERFGELALEFDLEASALLALKLSLTGYHKTAPYAALPERPPTFVA